MESIWIGLVRIFLLHWVMSRKMILSTEADLQDIIGKLRKKVKKPTTTCRPILFINGNPTWTKRKQNLLVPRLVSVLKAGVEIELTPLELWSDRVFEEWHLSDHITIPTRVYKMYSPGINFISPQQGKYRGSMEVKLLDFYGGRRFSVVPNLTYFFNKHLNAMIEYQYDHIQFPVEYSDNGKGLFQSSLH